MTECLCGDAHYADGMAKVSPACPMHRQNMITDQQFLKICYGNEDKVEDQDLEFSSSKEVANYLRRVASRIERYDNSKAYRASDECVLDTEIRLSDHY